MRVWRRCCSCCCSPRCSGCPSVPRSRVHCPETDKMVLSGFLSTNKVKRETQKRKSTHAHSPAAPSLLATFPRSDPTTGPLLCSVCRVLTLNFSFNLMSAHPLRSPQPVQTCRRGENAATHAATAPTTAAFSYSGCKWCYCSCSPPIERSFGLALTEDF